MISKESIIMALSLPGRNTRDFINVVNSKPLRAPKTWPLLVIVLLLSVFAVMKAPAQDISGRLRGRVVDASGAVIPGATLRAHNERTGTEQTAQSNKDGDYAFESLEPGSYTVSAEAQGFAQVRSEHNVIDARTPATLLIHLSVGSVSQQVEVSSTAAQVDTTTPTLQQTLNNAEVEALPIIGRDARNTVETTQPGSVQGESGNNGPRTRVNGQRGATNNYQVDGQEAIEYLVGNAAPLPAPENLEEYSVITNSAGAEYGTSAGSQVSVVVKSGTNSLHGAGWTYFRNTGLDANLWSNKRGGTITPRPIDTQQWYGGNIGGPILIPHIYDGRNKTFWFFSYEYTNPATGAPQDLYVPTNAERAGDFSHSAFGTPKINGVTTPTLNPANFSPMAKFLLANASTFLPEANSGPNANGDLNQYRWNGLNSDTNKATLVKLNHQFSNKHRIFGTLYRWTDVRQQDPWFGINFSFQHQTPPNEGVTNYEQEISTYTFNDTYELTPNILNNLVVGITHFNGGPTIASTNPALNWSALGVTGAVPDTGVSPTQIGILVNGWGGPGFEIWGNTNNPNPAHQISVTDNFTWVKGRHTIKAGYYERVLHQEQRTDYNAGGAYNFANYNPNSSGNAFADFLLGQGATFMQTAVGDLKWNYPAREGYLQDQLRANERITFSLGLRYAPNFGLSEDQGEISAFRPGRQSMVFPNAPLGLLVAGDAGITKAGYNPTYTNLAPRIGVAVDLTGKGKLVFRGGYGINYDYQNLSDYGQFASSSPYGYTYNTPAGQNASVTNPYNGPSPFPYIKPIPGTTQATNFQFVGRQTILSFDQNNNAGRIYQWNATLEWQPFSTYVLRSSYVGTRGTHLVTSTDANSPVFVPGASTNANAEARRPYAAFESIFATHPSATSEYESMQIVLLKQFAKGFSLNANYTLSRAHDDGETTGRTGSATGYRDPYHPEQDYGVSDFDVLQNFNLLYTYKPDYFKHAHNLIAREVLSGWEFSGIAQARSGQAIGILSPYGFDAASADNAFANYVGGNPYGTRNIRKDPSSRWLNQAAYCPADAFGSGCTVDPNAGVSYLALGNYVRGSTRGPGAFLNSMSLTKGLPISEKFGSINGTVTATNVFNHTILGNPDAQIGDGSNFGSINGTAAGPRNLQLALHYTF